MEALRKGETCISGCLRCRSAWASERVAAAGKGSFYVCHQLTKDPRGWSTVQQCAVPPAGGAAERCCPTPDSRETRDCGRQDTPSAVTLGPPPGLRAWVIHLLPSDDRSISLRKSSFQSFLRGKFIYRLDLRLLSLSQPRALRSFLGLVCPRFHRHLLLRVPKLSGSSVPW